MNKKAIGGSVLLCLLLSAAPVLAELGPSASIRPVPRPQVLLEAEPVPDIFRTPDIMPPVAIAPAAAVPVLYSAVQAAIDASPRKDDRVTLMPGDMATESHPSSKPEGDATDIEAGNIVEAFLPQRFKTTAGFDDDYRRTRDTIVSAMLNATQDGKAMALADYAQFLLANMMVPEARSIVTRIVSLDENDEMMRVRMDGYSAILEWISEPDRTSLTPLPELWGPDPLWDVLIWTEEGRPTSVALGEAFASLGDYGSSIYSFVLPRLFDMALLLNDTGLAEKILQAATIDPDLSDTDALKVMYADFARKTGDTKIAFEIYMDVSGGRGEPAAKSRLAIAEIAISRKDRSLLPEVLEILKIGMQDWRGDDLALKIRVRLAEISEELQDIESSIIVMTSIAVDHPGTIEADLAYERAGVVMAYLATKIRNDEYEVEAALPLLRNIETLVLDRPEWIDVRSAFAELLANKGLVEAALAEYSAIWRDLRYLGGDFVERDAIDQLVLKHTSLLLRSEDMKSADLILSKRTAPINPDLLVEFATLSASASGNADTVANLLTGFEGKPADVADFQLELARQAMKAGQLEKASAAYDKSLGLSPNEHLSDRLDALRLAAKLKEVDLTKKRSNLLSSEEALALQPVLNGLSGQKPNISPLSLGGANSSISGAKITSEAVRAILQNPSVTTVAPDTDPAKDTTTP